MFHDLCGILPLPKAEKLHTSCIFISVLQILVLQNNADNAWYDYKSLQSEENRALTLPWSWCPGWVYVQRLRGWKCPCLRSEWLRSILPQPALCHLAIHGPCWHRFLWHGFPQIWTETLFTRVEINLHYCWLYSKWRTCVSVASHPFNQSWVSPLASFLRSVMAIAST